MKSKQKVVSKVSAVALGLGIIAGTVFGAVAFTPEPVEIESIVYENVSVPVEVIKEVPVEVEKVVEKEVFVEVDNGDMAWAFQRLEDKMVIDDAEEILEELKQEDSALELALKEFDDRANIFDLLEDEGLISDEDEVSIIKIYSDFEDVEVVKSDFDDSLYQFLIDIKVEDKEADSKKKFQFSIKVEDGDSTILSVTEL